MMTTPASEGIVMAQGSEEAKPAAMMSAPAQSCHTWWLSSCAKATKHSDESSISEPSAASTGQPEETRWESAAHTRRPAQMPPQ